MNKYYIFAPANTCSGGPEALHQLAYYMRLCNLDAYVVYYADGFVDANPIERYLQYEPHVVSFHNVEDKKENFFIAPENTPWCLNSIHKAQKVILWLSVAYHQIIYPSCYQRMSYLKRRILNQTLENARVVLYNDAKCMHLCGSKHAYEYVIQKYPNSIVRYLVEPISKDFLDMGNGAVCGSEKRKNIVLYNPSKPSKRMTELLNRGRFDYIPLRGYTPCELAQKYRESKLYVDFGEFGGPERIPKEAVYFGCNILVANHNAASNDFDVAIPDQYKIDDSESVEVLEQYIADMLDNYEIHCPFFDAFRKKIEALENNYMQQIKDIFTDV